MADLKMYQVSACVRLDMKMYIKQGGDNFICCEMHSSMSIAIMKRSNTLFLLTAARAHIL
jgi:hypothetical protein